MKKLWPFEDEHAKLSGNFAAKTPFGRVFCSCETALWHTSAISQLPNPILQLRNGLRKWHPAAKIPFGCEMFSQPHSYPLPNPPFAAKMAVCCQMIFKLPNGYEMISKLWNGCEITSKLQNGLQIAKLTCEIEEGLQKHLAKPREVAKMRTEPRDHASEEESPTRPGITHIKSLTPFFTSLNHQSP